MFKVAIVGRPNVGKSSFFNLLINKRKAITDNVPNTTVDRLYGLAKWMGKSFQVIDTGGLEKDNTPFKEAIIEQVNYAINEANLIIMLADINNLTDDDYLVASYLKKYQKEVMLILNKADNETLAMNQYDFYKLGFKDLFVLSIKHKIGLGDILDFITSKIELAKINPNDELIKFTIVGRPNSGKSSLANLILGEDRSVVSPIEGTTVDAINSFFKYQSQTFEVIDTAGLLRRGKEVSDKEKYAQMRALSALDECDLAIMLLDINDGIKELDKNIAGYIKERNKGVIIVANKWDLIKKNDLSYNEYLEKIKQDFKMFQYAPIIFSTNLNKKSLPKILDTVIKVNSNLKKEIKTNILNEILAKTITINPPKPFNNGIAKFKYITQIGVNPIKFLLFVNNPDYVHFTYLRYLENEFRNALDFEGAPIIFEISKGE